jgi:hypothetical protein
MAFWRMVMGSECVGWPLGIKDSRSALGMTRVGNSLDLRPGPIRLVSSLVD